MNKNDVNIGEIPMSHPFLIAHEFAQEAEVRDDVISVALSAY